jgi:hypothetical protein
MPHISSVPFEQVPPELRKVMRAYDRSIGASEFVEVFAHSPEVAASFFQFYLPAMVATRGRIDMRITELARLKVAEKSCAKP